MPNFEANTSSPRQLPFPKPSMVSAIYRRVVSRVPPAPCNLQNGTAFSIFANFGICNLRQPRGFARTIGTFRPSPTLCQRQPPTGLFLPLLGSSSESDTPTKRPKRPRRLDPSPPIDLKQFSVLLQNEGFTEVQAEALIGLVSEAITERCACK